MTIAALAALPLCFSVLVFLYPEHIETIMIVKDPVCGRDVDTEKAIVTFKLGNDRYRYFCSECCAQIFQKTHLGL
jgi:YHS domain-containing protein